MVTKDIGPYSSLILFYFSGTGNAKTISEWMSNVAREAGLPVQLHRIEEVRKQDALIIPKNALCRLLQRSAIIPTGSLAVKVACAA